MTIQLHQPKYSKMKIVVFILIYKMWEKMIDLQDL